MKTVSDFQKFLQGMIDRHGKNLSIILSKFGIYEEATPQILLSAYLTYGDDFIHALEQLPEEHFSISDLPSLFQQGASIAAQAQSTYNQVSNTLSNSQPGSASPFQAPAQQSPPPPPPATNSTKKVIIIGAIVVGVLIVALVLIKTKKK